MHLTHTLWPAQPTEHHSAHTVLTLVPVLPHEAQYPEVDGQVEVEDAPRRLLGHATALDPQATPELRPFLHPLDDGRRWRTTGREATGVQRALFCSHMAPWRFVSMGRPS